jgi:CubicO group peptidase (beta-lactamase class C family)
MAVLLLAASPAGAVSLDKAPPVLAAEQALDPLILDAMSRHAVPGLQIAIVAGDTLLLDRSYGLADVASGRRVTGDTRFRLASMSKLFTAIAIMQLRDAGRLALDDRVTDHLAWFRLQGDPHPAITLRELLLQLAGLPREALGTSWADRRMPDRDALIRDMPEEPESIPREAHWKYSNLGYAVLGLVIEAASGESYESYVGRHILVPLGMTQTVVVPPADLADLATGYGQRLETGREPRAFLPMGGITPAAGLVSTASDMAKLARWMLADRDSPILSAASRREMLRAQAIFPDWSGAQAIGFELRRVAGSTRIGHAGQAAGYAGRIEVDPEAGLGVVVLTNADEGGIARLIDQTMALFAPAIAAATPPAPVSVPDPAWSRYVGTYSFEHRDSAIAIVDGRLVWLDPAAADPLKTKIQLDPAGPGRFRFASGGLMGEILSFETDAAGKVIRLRAGGEYDWRK